MYLLENVCRGPLDIPGWGDPYGAYWGHGETPMYLYACINDLFIAYDAAVRLFFACMMQRSCGMRPTLDIRISESETKKRGE